MRRKNNNGHYIIIILVIMLLLLTLLLDDKLGSRVVTVITVGTALAGAIALFVQYKRDKNISQATFILEYAKYFYSLNGTEETLMNLDRYRNGEKGALKKVEYSGVINYLFWCEELSALYQKGIVDFKTIDNLFSYTFFLITNNKYIQELELVPQAEYYKGVYFLHNEWTAYKKETKQPILCEEESLSNVKDYNLYVKKGDVTYTKVY